MFRVGPGRKYNVAPRINYPRKNVSRSSAHCESAALVDEVMIKSFDWDGL